MTDQDPTLAKAFAAPICPACATGYDPQHFDIYEDRACCPNCGTEYRVPAEYRALHPEDYLEYGVAKTLEAIALSRFRVEAGRIADATMQQTGGASYELYARRFSEACNPYIDALDPALRDQAVTIANYHGCIDETDDAQAGFGPGLCPISGIDEDCCHCGWHQVPARSRAARTLRSTRRYALPGSPDERKHLSQTSHRVGRPRPPQGRRGPTIFFGGSGTALLLRRRWPPKKIVTPTAASRSLRDP